MLTTRPNWRLIALFYVLACAWSWPFFWWRDINPESWKAWDVPGFVKTWSYMCGPAIAAFIALAIARRKHERRITLLGANPGLNLAFYWIPIAILSIIGMQTDSGKVSHASVWVIGVFGFVSMFGEEMGWRGFLQDALRPLRPVHRYILIGLMWEAWHFTNRTHVGPLSAICIRVAIFSAVCIALSVLIGELTERTRSVMVAVTCHFWFDALFEMGKPAYISLAISIPFWIWLVRKQTAQSKLVVGPELEIAR